MLTTVRAAVSVVMLAGFYLLAGGLITGLAAVAVWLWREYPGAVAGKLSIFVVLAAGGLVVAFWRALRAKPTPPEGLRLDPQQVPLLWGCVRDLATRVGTRPPDEIRLVPEVNAAVTEQARLLGLLPGRRIMYVGLPLLQAFTVAQLRSVLAHELGHYSGNHTRIGALAHRGRLAIVQTLDQLGDGNVVGWLLRWYARLYILVEQAVSRRLEYEADRASVLVAGRAAAAGALRELPALDAAWGFFLSRYVETGWKHGYVPTDVFGGFRLMLSARAEELARLRAHPPVIPPSRWDSHPPIPDRIAAIEAQPDPGLAQDDRPAAVLVPDLAGQAHRVQAELLDAADRRSLPWQEFTAAAVAGHVQRHADVLFRAAARLTGAAEGDLGLVLDLLATGRGGELVRTAAPHARPTEAAEVLADLVDSAIAAAVVAAGRGYWRHSWTSPAELVDPAGVPVPTVELAKRACEPASVAEVRGQLDFLGIDVRAGRQSAEQQDAVDAQVLGGIANLRSGKQSFDVFVLNQGLLLVPGPKGTDDGRRRLIQLLESMPLRQLVGQHRLIRFEEFVSATIVKQIPVRVEITLRGGERIELRHGWTGETLGKNDAELLCEILAPFVRAAG